ncbi:MAG: tol-pal system protein YbgF [Chitinophagaceae bacterium]|nr:tol-pal system protein YbgF [Rubrivivax sp.]
MLVAALGAVSAPTRAGLFDDEEARKAIVDLRARITQSDERAGTRLAELSAGNAQLLEQLAAMRRSLLDLNNQLEAMRTDMARLRGSDEQLAKDLGDVQRRQKDLGQALDDRLRKIEPVKVTIDGREALVEPEEKQAYEEAIAVVRSGDFDKAVAALGQFQRRYPVSAYGDSARFWTGNALYGKRDYKGAIGSFRSFVASSPEHPRAPEALLALANSQAEMKDPRAARKTIDELLKTYPRSEAAQAGKERLASIR